MKKITNKLLSALILLIVISATISLRAQSGWEMVYSENSELGSVKGFSFVPGTNGLWETGYAAQFDGNILKTTDGGATWTQLTYVIPEYIWGVSFGDENIGYVAGQSGSIYKTTNGGTTWTSVYFNNGDSFSKVAFKDVNNGVATGYPNSIYTSDGGATWGAVVGNDNNYWSLDYAAGDTYYGVEAFTGEVGRSTDNGETWNEAHNTDLDLTICVNFFDDNVGIVGGFGGTVQVTTDGSATWSEQSISDVEILAASWFDADTVWASGEGVFKSTDQGQNWIQDTTIFGAGLYSRELFVTGMNVVIASASSIGTGDLQIWRKVGLPPIGADFVADPTTICAGSTVDFTDTSNGVIDTWKWTFEGGTPASSTDQNPTVTYGSPGEFDVKLVVTVGTLADSTTKENYISAILLPEQANMPTGEAEVCTGANVEYSADEVLYAQDYDWEVSPSDAGVLSSDMNTATLNVSDTWTGDYAVRVRATNICGNGDWSDDLSGTVYLSPSEFVLEGGGGYCLGSDGVELTLSGSQSGIDYELYLDGTTTGIVVAGTGSELSFGLLTEEGFYEATAFSTSCMSPMQEQVQVEILYAPVEPGSPDGPVAICDESSSDYTSTGSDDADSYGWTLYPDDAGSISFDGLEATVNWNSEYEGVAVISIYGMNDCGSGNSSVLEVAVGAANPIILGEEMVCDFSDEIYEVANNEGSTYAWIVTGGAITEGQGTYMITISWTGEGNGTISVDEETASGCSGTSEQFEVLIDDCTGIGENDAENTLSIYPNPVKNILNVSFNSNSTSGVITIYDITGQVAFEKEFQGNNKEQQVNVSTLTDGMYLVKIQTGGKVLNSKLFIKN